MNLEEKWPVLGRHERAALAATEGRPALAVLDGWFPGVAVPYVAAVAASGSMKDGEDPGGLDRPARPRDGSP